MQKPIILFDLDRTLVDNERFNQNINRAFRKILGEKLMEKYLIIRATYLSSLKASREYNPENLVAKILEGIGYRNRKRLLNVFYGTPKIYKRILFEDTKPVLKKMRKKYRLGVFSEGTLKFQHYKLDHLGIKKYFEKDLVYIFENKTLPSALKNIPREALIIDDNQKVVKAVKKQGFNIVLINRPGGDNLLNMLK